MKETVVNKLPFFICANIDKEEVLGYNIYWIRMKQKRSKKAERRE